MVTHKYQLENLEEEINVDNMEEYNIRGEDGCEDQEKDIKMATIFSFVGFYTTTKV